MCLLAILPCWQIAGHLAVQVSRPTFVRALEEGGSVIMVPGGQAELVHTWRFFKRQEFVIYKRHKGGPRVLCPIAPLTTSMPVLSPCDLLQKQGSLRSPP